MGIRLDSSISGNLHDALIYDSKFVLDTGTAEIKNAQAGVIKRGTVIRKISDNGETSFDIAESMGEAYGILTTDIDTSMYEQSESIVIEYYKTGHFSQNAVNRATGYKISVKDKDDLRKNGILMSVSVEIE